MTWLSKDFRSLRDFGSLRRTGTCPRKRGHGTRLVLACLLAGACCVSCGRQGDSGEADTGEDAEVTTRGSCEVTAQLLELRGTFPDLPNYHYAFVMKYKVLQVHRGKIDGDTIYVAHYDPHKPRAAAADVRAEGIGGNLRQFEAGDEHRMALEAPIDDYYMGGMINRYFKEWKGPIYWAVWTNRVVR